MQNKDTETENHARARGYFFILCAITLFSTIEVVSKSLQSGEGSGAVGAVQVATARFVLGALFLLLFSCPAGKRASTVSALRKDGLPLLVLGAVGVFLTFLLFHRGIDMASAATVAVVFSLNPVFAAAVARSILHERLSVLNCVGIAIGLTGAFLAVTGSNAAGPFNRSDFRGSLLALLAAVTWACYTVLGKKYSERYGGLLVATTSVTAGAALFAVFLAIAGGWGEFTGCSAADWIWLVYLGVVTVGLGYYLYFTGFRYVTASRGASLFYLKPVLGVVFASVFLGEEISGALIAAALLASGGVFLVALERGRPAPPD